MLPSFGGRIVSILGMLAGCAAIYLSEWGVEGVPSFVWKVLSLLAVCSLFAMRYMGKTLVSMDLLRARAGDGAVNKLINLRRLAILLVLISLAMAILIAPLISDLSTRHFVLLSALGIAALSILIFTFVEIKFRSLLDAADIKY